MRSLLPAVLSASPAAALALVAALSAPCLALAGCGAAAAQAAPSEPLPPYTPESAQTFDDAIDPHAVGLELEASGNPRNDPRVRARAKACDEIVRARVITITGEASGGSRAYHLILKSVEHLGGKRPVGDEFTLNVDQTSPSIGIVKSMEGQLVGKVFVVYLKAFGRPDGERDLHFHASADEPNVVAAAKNAVLLDELK
jgi:hypothetical protein